MRQALPRYVLASLRAYARFAPSFALGRDTPAASAFAAAAAMRLRGLPVSRFALNAAGTAVSACADARSFDAPPPLRKASIIIIPR